MPKQSTALKLTLLLVSSLTIMSMVTISPSLPEMSVAFSGVANAEFLVQLVLTLPALFIALGSPVAGVLIDRYGRLRLLWGALVLYAVSGVAGYFIDDIYQLLFSRALLGIAVGISMTIVTTLVADYFEGMARQRFVGIQVAFMSIGGIVFIGLGGVLADISWRLPFFIYLVAAVVLPMAILFLYEPERMTSVTDQASQLRSPPIIWLLFANVMAMWILFFLIPVQLPFHLKAIGVEKNALIGAAIAMSTAFSAVSSFSYSRIRDKFSYLSIFAMGYFLMALAFGLVAMAQSYGLVVLGMMLAGLGIGMMIPNTNMWVMQIAPLQIRGREIGRLTTFWFMGQFLSPLVLWPIAQVLSLSGIFYLFAGILLALSVFFLLMQLRAARKMPATS